MDMRKWLLIVLILGLFIGCTQQAQQTPTPTPTPSPAPSPAPTPTPQPAPSTDGNVKEFKITAKQWTFEPAEIIVKKGDRVRLLITSVDVKHGFGIAELGIEENLEPGKTITVEFDAEQEGTYTFYCSVFCGQGHQQMTGRLIID